MRFAAVDLGASSGRVMVGEVGPDTLRLTAAARFPNDPVRTDDGLHWDVEALVDHAVAGLATAYAEGPLASIGVDSWAVDYGRLRHGRLLGQPFHYRDERRTAEGPAAVADLIGAQELYRRNGLQYLPFNTLYQLAADTRPGRGRRDPADPRPRRCLPGRQPRHRAHQRLHHRAARRHHPRVGHRADDPARPRPDALPRPRRPRRRASADLLPHVAERVGGVVPVVAVGSHDTASAVVGVPMQTDDAAYVSLGTWALAGLELDAPVLTEEARAASLTNEGGVDGTVRFLSNVMGTWLLSETLRTWGETDLAGMLRAAAAVRRTGAGRRRAGPSFPATRRHAGADRRLVRRARCRSTATVGSAVVRCIVREHRGGHRDRAANGRRALAGRRIGVVHVVGGGSQNTLLCQAIADRTGLPVLAGPVEATALGNVLVQARAAGVVGPGLADLRALVARTHDLARFEPRG